MAAAANHNKISRKQAQEYRGQLLSWYDAHQRDIPWRIKSGQKADPYKVWLSEIMCQQTTVQAVKAYYAKFLKKWPTVKALAAAPEADIMEAWAGLGYYARARNLHKCAKTVAGEFKGVFPRTELELKKLPGIGDYTAAAIAAIAFGMPTTVVDGNVERVMARFFAIEEPLPLSKPLLKDLAAQFYNGFDERPGDLAQAFMDLGAGICIPKAPRCGLCPLSKSCQGYKTKIAASLPRKITAKARPIKHGYVYWFENKNGEVLFQKRPGKGLLGGMVGLPTGPWASEISGLNPGIKPKDIRHESRVFHTFTHFDLELIPVKPKTRAHGLNLEEGFYWAKPEKELGKLPSVFKKAFITLSSL